MKVRRPGQPNLTNTLPPASSSRVLATQAAVDAWKANRQAIIQGLASLSSRGFNWGGEKELPAREDVIRDLKYGIMGAYGMDLRNLPRPEMDLLADGTIEMAFTLGKRSVVLTFLCSLRVSYWKSCDDGAMIDGVIELPLGALATGFAYAIDEITGWLLEGEQDWR
jgi:hypothetical protein